MRMHTTGPGRAAGDSACVHREGSVRHLWHACHKFATTALDHSFLYNAIIQNRRPNSSSFQTIFVPGTQEQNPAPRNMNPKCIFWGRGDSGRNGGCVCAWLHLNKCLSKGFLPSMFGYCYRVTCWLCSTTELSWGSFCNVTNGSNLLASWAGSGVGWGLKAVSPNCKNNPTSCFCHSNLLPTSVLPKLHSFLRVPDRIATVISSLHAAILY